MKPLTVIEIVVGIGAIIAAGFFLDDRFANADVVQKEIAGVMKEVRLVSMRLDRAMIYDEIRFLEERIRDKRREYKGEEMPQECVERIEEWQKRIEKLERKLEDMKEKESG